MLLWQDMDKVLKVYKKVGQTPLDCIDNLKKERTELGLLPITYAGRLDPLAEGVLLLLVGEECKRKDEYLNLPKVYEVEVLFGFTTDTYDILGKLTSSEDNRFKMSRGDGGGSQCQTISNRSSSDLVLLIEKFLPEFIGKIKQSYPPYSSRPVNGKPLFMWAREGKLDEIEIPTHSVFIENIEIAGNREILGKELLEEIKEKLFKQTIEQLKQTFEQTDLEKLQTLYFDFDTTDINIELNSDSFSGIFNKNLGRVSGQ